MRQLASGALLGAWRNAGFYVQREIAERTGAPLDTVKSRMALGLLRMRRSLEAGTTEATADVSADEAVPRSASRSLSGSPTSLLE